MSSTKREKTNHSKSLEDINGKRGIEAKSYKSETSSNFYKQVWNSLSTEGKIKVGIIFYFTLVLSVVINHSARGNSIFYYAVIEFAFLVIQFVFLMNTLEQESSWKYNYKMKGGRK